MAKKIWLGLAAAWMATACAGEVIGVPPTQRNPDESATGGNTGTAGNTARNSDWACQLPPTSSNVSSSCACSRRSTETPHVRCPRGFNKSSSTVIGPDGGTLYLSPEQGGVFLLNFPPGAVERPTTIRVVESEIDPPAGFIDWSPVFLVEPAGLEVKRPVVLQVPFGNSCAPVGPIDLLSFECGGSGYSEVPNAYQNDGFMYAAITKLSHVIVAQSKPSAEDL